MKKFGIVALSFLVSFSLISATLAADLFEKDIKYGVANNNDVKQLQDFLYNEGFYKGPVTGNFYTLTRNALKKYQLANKITPANGLLNSATREKLNSTLLAQETTSEEVLGSDDVSYTTDDEAARLAWVARMTSLQNQNVSQQTQPTVQPVINNYYTSPVTYNVLPVVTSSPQVVSNPEPIPNQVVTTTISNATNTPIVNPTITLNASFLNSYQIWKNGTDYRNCGGNVTSSVNRSLLTAQIATSTTDDVRYIKEFSIANNSLYLLKSITLKNEGTADLSNIDFEAFLSDLEYKTQNNISLTITSATQNEITFAVPQVSPLDKYTRIIFKVNSNKIKLGETFDFKITNLTLRDNGYSIAYPVQQEEPKYQSILRCKF